MKVSEGKMKIVSVAYVDAGNNASGNPRRGWIVLTDDTIRQRRHFVDEGYEGPAALRRYGFTPEECADIENRAIHIAIIPREYLRLKRTASKEARDNE